MRLRHFKLAIYGFLLLLLMGSCSRFTKIQKSEDPMVKYKAALEYYEDERYSKAAILLEDILPLLTGLPEGENAQFLYAYSHFHQRLYIESAHYFREFYTTYGRSPKAEEALYMNAYSLYLQSPRYNLDQTSTLEAITALQNFINLYPQSQYREKATQYMDDLQQKLAKKAFDNAVLYYNTGRYKAALVVLDTFSQDFPDSEYNEEAAFTRILAAYDYAQNSYAFRQKERFSNVVEIYLEFIDKYPQSKFIEQAERVYLSSQAELEKIKENTSTTANNNL